LLGSVAAASDVERPLHPHYFTGVDVPLADAFDVALADERSLDSAGIPLGARARRDLLLASAVRLELGAVERRGGTLEIPVTVENVGGGPRVPAGFSQERELWVHLRVTDERGRLLYEVGRVRRHDEDLHDKVFLRVTKDVERTDGAGRPLGHRRGHRRRRTFALAAAPSSAVGFSGSRLVNFQNGPRCVRCIGRIDAAGRCEPLPGQSEHGPIASLTARTA
jgi:hypothetical protein